MKGVSALKETVDVMIMAHKLLEDKHDDADEKANVYY
jgi:hypothetical protein